MMTTTKNNTPSSQGIWRLVFLFAIVVCLWSFEARAQKNVGIGTAHPDRDAILDLKSTTQGLLVPRMTTSERFLMDLNIDDDALLVYDLDFHRFFFWHGPLLRWEPLEVSVNGGSTPLVVLGSTNGSLSIPGNSASSVVMIPHNLHATPKSIHVKAVFAENANELISSDGYYNGATQNSVSSRTSSGFTDTEVSSTKILSLTNSSGSNQSATMTFDSANIYLTFTLSGTLSPNPIRILWDAEVY